MPPEIASDVALSLAFAVVAASTAPLLLLDEKYAIIAASGSFSAAFGLGDADPSGHSLFALGAGEWNLPRLRALLDATLSGGAVVPGYEIDFRHPVSGGRRLVLNAHVLEYTGGSGTRLLLSVADVTDARLAARQHEDLIAEKAMLMQEVQHRVANSLQIIASVLMQSARRVSTSPEAQQALKHAHSRVMSVAALQRLLAESASGEVDIGRYLRQLCQTLTASMIEFPDRIRLSAVADDVPVLANTSVSLGLVVTELVINALKHAFPGKRDGTIDVLYDVDGAGWTLTVRDNGIGMPAGDTAVAGLGTNIVKALAHHLDAVVEVSDAGPGTCVRIVHAAKADGDFDLAGENEAV